MCFKWKEQFMQASREIKTVKGTFVVLNDRGLHTRPSTEIVKCAVKFKSEIKLLCRRQEVNAKSLLGILMLAATKNTRIRIEAKGPDAEEAVAALIELAGNSFNINY
jgi:phosphocarrier protein HPr